MEIEFPIEFLVQGTPVSLQARRPQSRDEWKERIKAASTPALPAPHFASGERIAITLFYLPDGPMQGDLDNIVKPILDALARHVYIDDRQIERILVQKFEPANVYEFTKPTDVLKKAFEGEKPVLYVRISNDPAEDLA